MKKLSYYIKKVYLIACLLAFLISFNSRAQSPVNYTTPGTYTWTVPPCVTSITVKVWGAGGGGGGAVGLDKNSGNDHEACAGAGGGGGGGFSTSTISVTPGQTFTVVVGEGGTAGTTGNGSWSSGITSNAGNGGNGGTSSFSGNTYNIAATGGNGGTSANSWNSSTSVPDVNVNGNGGAGGNGSGGTTNYSGGAGAGGNINISANHGLDKSGGGGGGAGPGGNGGNATHNSSTSNPPGGAGQSPGGKGGDGRYYNSTNNGGSNGNAGAGYGGGGSGAVSHSIYNLQTNSGGKGADGAVIIEYTVDGSIPATPTITSTPPSCSTAGTSTISNYNAAYTYTFTPAGPTVGASGSISNMAIGTSYTVTASSGSCPSNASSSFSNAAQLSTPTAPTAAPQNFCGTATVANLVPSGTGINWYSASSGGTPLAGTTALATGTYYVSQTTGGCESNRTPAAITVTTKPGAPTITSTPPSCSAAGTSTISNYNAAYTYTFTPAGPTVGASGSISNMAIGTSYTVTASSGSCPSNASSSFSNAAQLSTPTAPTAAPQNFCGTATVANLVPSGTGINWYSASSGGTPLAGTTALATGTYYVSQTTGGCESNRTSVTVTVVEQPTITVGTVTPTSCGSSNGSIDISVTGGTAPYTFAWSNGATSQNLSGVAAGNYTVTVTDDNGCTATNGTGTNITNTAAPTVTVGTVTQASCGSSNGSIDISVTGGTAPYTFAWSNGATSQNLSGVAAGNYTVTVTDNNGCTATNGTGTNITNTAAPTVTVGTVTQASCGSSNGSIDISVTGGTAPYTFAWSNGATSQNLSGVAAGNYTVTVTDNNGCTATNGTGTNITNTAAPTVTVGTVTQASCGSSNGSIDISVTGGTAPYTFAWSNGATSQNLSGVAAGNYTVTVTDNNGCTATNGTGTNITNTAAPTVTVGTVTQASCGSSNGSIDISVTGGTAPYTFAWSNGATSQNLSGVAAGNYTVTVTDNNGCTATNGTGTNITNTAAPTVTVGTVTQASCGSSNGSIDISVTGGTAPYTFAWSNGATSKNLSGVAAGNYTVTVTDNNGCTATNGTGTNITNTAAPTVTVGTVTQASCGSSNGNIDISVTGGTAPYTFAWSNGATSQNLSGVAAGNYTVTVTDNNGCTATNGTGTTITNTAAPTVTVGTVTQASCGSSNGSIDISVTGGTAPYTFAWSNGATSQNLSGVAAGNYTVTVTDNNGCTATNGTGTTITNTAAPTVTVGTVTQASCGSSNGSIDISVTGGTAPYTFAWSNGATSQNLSGVAAGNYTVTVTDDNGCTATNGTGTNITNTTAPTVTVGTVTQASCGSSNGSIDISVTGGTAPYTFAWSNGATSQNLSGVAAGNYTVTVTDDNGCTATNGTGTNITNTTAPTVTVGTVTQASCGSSNGSIDISVTGGTAPYTFAWSNGATSQNLSGVVAGNYTVTVTDNNGCIQNGTATVPNDDSLHFSIIADTTKGCSPLAITFSSSIANADSYLWNFGDGTTSGSSNPVHTFTRDTCFNVSLSIALGGCTSTAKMDSSICVFPTPEAAFIASTYEITNIYNEVYFTNQSQNATSYEWYFGDETGYSTKEHPKYVYDPEIFRNYTVVLVAKNDKGCTDTARVVIKMSEDIIFYVPNTFTPDGDEFNNVFKPVIAEGYDNFDYEMLIFNRWGEIIFETHNTKVGWDGTYLGKVCPEGTYVWKIIIKKREAVDKIEKTGHITLLR